MSDQRLSRQEYLDFMSDTWDTFLGALNGLPDDEQQRYARQQGYPSLKAVLAHIDDWWEETLRVVPIWAKGDSPQFDYEDFDTFETRAMARHHDQTLAQVEQDFDNLRGQVAAMIAELPEEAFSDPQIADWLDRVIVTHYRQHAPSADPQIPSAKYEKVYKNE